MNWKITIEKALKGLATIVASILISSQDVIIDFVSGILPEWLDPQMTIAGVVGAAIIAVANWFKHKAD